MRFELEHTLVMCFCGKGVFHERKAFYFVLCSCASSCASSTAFLLWAELACYFFVFLLTLIKSVLFWKEMLLLSPCQETGLSSGERSSLQYFCCSGKVWSGQEVLVAFCNSLFSRLIKPFVHWVAIVEVLSTLVKVLQQTEGLCKMLSFLHGFAFWKRMNEIRCYKWGGK